MAPPPALSDFSENILMRIAASLEKAEDMARLEIAAPCFSRRMAFHNSVAEGAAGAVEGPGAVTVPAAAPSRSCVQEAARLKVCKYSAAQLRMHAPPDQRGFLSLLHEMQKVYEGPWNSAQLSFSTSSSVALTDNNSVAKGTDEDAGPHPMSSSAAVCPIAMLAGRCDPVL
jgi:hypothetical protein